ncbi:MAG TPA: dynamin family protein, partial [bacterium]|nr:dynamin family protein [bacterium]
MDTRIKSRFLDRLAEICVQFGITALQPQIEACREVLRQQDLIDIAVLGRFKAGKSSFLNCLAGRSVLPIGVIPVTTVVTRLSYGPAERAEVRFLDGETSETAVDEIGLLVTEAENPDNRKRVRSVDVELPALKAHEGLRFADTPGLGSIFKHNTEMAREWLPRVGAALVAMSVDAPLSEEDRSLLRDIKRHAPRIALLLTKADLKTEKELGEIEAFVKEGVMREFGEDFSVFPVSTKAGHPKEAAWRSALVRNLLDPLRENREAEWSGIVSHKLGNLRGECEDYLRIALRSAGAVTADCERFKDQILTEDNRLASMRDEIRGIAKECASKTRPMIREALKGFRRPLEEKLARELKSRLPSWRMNLWKLSRTFESWLEEAFRREIGIISRSEREKFLTALETPRTRLMRTIQSFRARLSAKIEDVLGVKRRDPEWNVPLKEPEAPNVAIFHVFDTQIDLVWFLIPMSLFQPLIHRHFLKRIPNEVEKNLSRLAAQWTDAINAVIH